MKFIFNSDSLLDPGWQDPKQNNLQNLDHDNIQSQLENMDVEETETETAQSNLNPKNLGEDSH